MQLVIFIRFQAFLSLFLSAEILFTVIEQEVGDGIIFLNQRTFPAMVSGTSIVVSMILSGKCVSVLPSRTGSVRRMYLFVPLV